MTLEAEGFLQEIIADPEDDTVRLIYADWLEDRGDPRGEFIRVQCELSELPEHDPRRTYLEAREWDLLQKHQSQWFLPLRQVHTYEKAEMRRGFLSNLSLRVSAPQMELIDRDLRWEPIQKLGVHLIEEDAEEAFLEWPFLKRIRSLYLGPGLPDRQKEPGSFLRQLLSAPMLTKLRSLRLYDSEGNSREAGKVLADSSSLSHLRSLELQGGHLGTMSLEAILKADHLCGLERFALLGIRLGTVGAQLLADARPWEDLKCLKLSATEITAEGVRSIGMSPLLSSLTELDLSHNGFRPGAMEGFFRSARLSEVTELRLAGNRLGTEGAMALASCPHLGNLRYLDLRENQIGDSGIRAIAESPYLGNLEVLGLESNQLTDEGITILGRAAFCENLRSLSLDKNAFSVYGIKALLREGLPELYRLSLAYCELGDRALQVVARSGKIPKLRHLNLNGNHIEEKGIVDFISQPTAPGVASLDLSHNPLSDVAIKALCSSETARGLCHFYMYGTRINPGALPTVLELAHSTALREIGLNQIEGAPENWHKARNAFGARLDEGIPF